jgi:hypothetical protein
MKILFEPNAANRARCLPGRCVRVKRRLGELPRFRVEGMVKELEAGVGIEPTNNRFAGDCLTTWLSRHRIKGLQTFRYGHLNC